MSRVQGNSKLIWAVVLGATALATALAEQGLEPSRPVEPEAKVAASPDGRTAEETGEPQPDSEQGGSPPSDTVPLDQAVATFNRKALSYLRPWVDQGTLLKTQLPAPLTVQDVVTAIADWQPSAADRKTAYPIYARIREKNVLPPRAELTYRLQWYPHDEHGTPDPQHEHWLWIIQLDVFTSETTGYSLPIRRRSLLRRAALTASPGYEWLVEPRQLAPVPSTPTRPSGTSSGSVHVVLDQASDGSLLVTASWLEAAGGAEGADLRAVAFDESGQRYVLNGLTLGAHSPLSGGVHRMARFRLDPTVLPLSRTLGAAWSATDLMLLKADIAVRA